MQLLQEFFVFPPACKKQLNVILQYSMCPCKIRAISRGEAEKKKCIFEWSFQVEEIAKRPNVHKMRRLGAFNVFQVHIKK